jgi:hypothetical protein
MSSRPIVPPLLPSPLFHAIQWCSIIPWCEKRFTSLQPPILVNLSADDRSHQKICHRVRDGISAMDDQTELIIEICFAMLILFNVIVVITFLRPRNECSPRPFSDLGRLTEFTTPENTRIVGELAPLEKH